MILLSEIKIRKFFLPNWSWARQPLSSARSTLLYPFQMLNAKQGSSNSHLLTSFGMTRPGIEPTTSRLWGGRSTDWANTNTIHETKLIIIKQNHVGILCNSARDMLLCVLSDTIHACAILQPNWAENANLRKLVKI